ncbi:hypothetical protein BDQ17DRAFT_1241971, partial [Cyathus striatus]
LVMCPDRKLEWFKVHGYTTQQVQDITNIVMKRWETSYKSSEAIVVPPVAQKKSSQFVHRAEHITIHNVDSIQDYLSEPVVSTEVVIHSGGHMQSWTLAEKK